MNETRVIHIKNAPANYLNREDCQFIGRHNDPARGYFGNPYIIGRDGDRDTCLALFQDYLLQRLQQDQTFRSRVQALYGKVLICFCAPAPCHGHNLAEAAYTLHQESHRVEVVRLTLVDVEAEREARYARWEAEAAQRRHNRGEIEHEICKLAREAGKVANKIPTDESAPHKFFVWRERYFTPVVEAHLTLEAECGRI